MILAAIFILFFIAILIASLNFTKIRPGYLWFAAIGAALSAGILVFFVSPAPPTKILLINWGEVSFLSSSPTLLIDKFSWPLSLAVIFLLLSVLLTDIIQTQEIDPGVWSASLVMTGAGLFAIFAGNPLTLLFSWAFIDIFEAITLLRKVSGSQQRERVVIAFSVRVVGMFMIAFAILRARVLGLTFTFDQIPIEIAGYLLLSAGLRLGVLPPHQPFIEEPPLRRGLGTVIRITPVAASLLLLNRVAAIGVSSVWKLPILLIAGFALIFGGIAWVRAKNELDGRPYWILTISTLAIIAAIQKNSLASQVWGLGLIFSGGLIFQYAVKPRQLLWLPVLGFLGISSLPFTPSWAGVLVFEGTNFLIGILLIVAQTLLILGYLRHALKVVDSQAELERFGWIIYPLGLAVLPIGHILIIWILGGFSIPKSLSTFIWWESILVLGLVAAIFILFRRNVKVPNLRIQIISETIQLNWIYQSFWWIYRMTTRLMSYISAILEGQGGVLWAILILILLITVYGQQGGQP